MNIFLLLETHRRPIGDRHAWLATHLIPIRDQNAWSETHLKLTCPNMFFQYIYIKKEFTKILLLWETYWRPIGDPLETYWRPIGDQSETHRRPTCLIRDPLETKMPDRRLKYLIGDPSETNKPHRRPIKDQHASSDTHMLDRRPIEDQHASSETVMPQWRPRHVGLRWASNETCRSLMGFQWDMLVSDGSPIRHVGIQWVSDNNNIFVNFIKI